MSYARWQEQVGASVHVHVQLASKLVSSFLNISFFTAKVKDVEFEKATEVSTALQTTFHNLTIRLKNDAWKVVVLHSGGFR